MGAPWGCVLLLPALPGFKSFTSTVLAAVPLVFHSSSPWIPSCAVNSKVPFTAVRFSIADPVVPTRISLTRIVPLLVPLLFHNSLPAVPSVAVKYKVPSTLVSHFGLLLTLDPDLI